MFHHFPPSLSSTTINVNHFSPCATCPQWLGCSLSIPPPPPPPSLPSFSISFFFFFVKQRLLLDSLLTGIKRRVWWKPAFSLRVSRIWLMSASPHRRRLPPRTPLQGELLLPLNVGWKVQMWRPEPPARNSRGSYKHQTGAWRPCSFETKTGLKGTRNMGKERFPRRIAWISISGFC